MSVNKHEEEEEEIEKGDEDEKDDEQKPDGDKADDTIDYAAELEREKKLRIRTSGALAEERKLRKEAEKKLAEKDKPKTEDDDQPDEDKTLDVDAKLKKFAVQQSEDFIDEQLEELTDNEDERKLIKHHFERLYSGSGSKREIIATLEDAHVLANKRKVFADAEKKARKSFAERAAMTGIGGKARAKQTEPENEATEDDRKAAEFAGMSVEDYLKYSKQLS